MPTPDRYSVLFESVKIGPVTAPNRFYQVPHCNSLGYMRPKAEAAMRRMKAQGGWGVICTQEVEIHPSSDLSPFPEGRLWDDRDIPGMVMMVDAVHEHGSLAGIELAHNGCHAMNHMTRATALAPSDMALHIPHPRQARAMDKEDIRNLRRWHQDATRRSLTAGFDIVYVYAGHHMTTAHHFMLPEYNQRMDEYGGSLENRVRLTRELLEDTLEICDGKAAVAFRFAVDEMMGEDGMQAHEEGRAVVELLAEMPDLWDVNVAGWDNDSQTTRFEPQDGYQMPYVDFVKSVTTKPVVGTGRLTSPDVMAGLINKGTLDFIGAARPSIADPFIPLKIKEDRIDEIRECIGCNICVSCDNLSIPIRCTQNPTMGEEWRRGWHPEEIDGKGKEEAALVVGAGPAGLECAMQLARRGYHVTLAEAGSEAGGRVLHESGLPGLSAWKRVADYRMHDLQQRANVDLYFDSELDADQVIELGIPNVFVATGSTWRTDGRGRATMHGVPIADGAEVLSPDDIMAGKMPSAGPVLVYDDDQGYLAAVLAEHLAQAGLEVVFVTPASVVSPFTDHTLEQGRVQTRLIELGVEIIPTHVLTEIGAESICIACDYSDRPRDVPARSAVLVTERHRTTGLYEALKASGQAFNHLALVGDAEAPGLIADAVWHGHLAAREFERDPALNDADWFRREITDLREES
ncbi:FAD-dependent oxidoreductase [Roseovarius sp. 2305UL8-3]|uniref:FAD-dependent oxidoreductase n=1 Tax=Roseovarius conchicola TaxID=3121636 RepID=UPI003528B92C